MDSYKVYFYRSEPFEGQEPDIEVTWKAEDLKEIIRDCQSVIVWKNFHRAHVMSSVCPKYLLKVVQNYYYRQ